MTNFEMYFTNFLEQGYSHDEAEKLAFLETQADEDEEIYIAEWVRILLPI